ncbi:MAG TPA: malonyl-ACP O-methyltransferase BioC, partial [Burkholderiales bacterium]|nr:malonyl-ACP O-methyltransferase BioC [Burkholderiales bacterium]
VVLDAGSGTGSGARELARRYPDAQVIALDIALSMLQAGRASRSWLQRMGMGRRRVASLCGDVEQLPLKTGSVDLIWSNATLQWATDLPATLRELQRVLRPGGLVMFSTFGPDTLKELRAAFAAADGHSHVNRFVDMHDIGDMLVHARLADPVMDMEHITLTYGTVRDLMRDLKAIGAHNVTAGRPRGLGGRQALRAAEEYYEAWRRNGVLPATYEVVYGHAWAPHAVPERMAGGHAVVQFHRRVPRSTP